MKLLILLLLIINNIFLLHVLITKETLLFRIYGSFANLTLYLPSDTPHQHASSCYSNNLSSFSASMRRFLPPIGRVLFAKDEYSCFTTASRGYYRQMEGETLIHECLQSCFCVDSRAPLLSLFFLYNPGRPEQTLNSSEGHQ